MKSRAELEGRLRALLSPKRFQHSAGVARISVRLAEIHGIEAGRAWVAGMLHDGAKDLPAGECASLLEREEPEVLIEFHDYPALWHAHAGAVLARKQFGVEDPEVLAAIRHHPTGHASFGPLGHALFIADYTEPEQRNPDHEALLQEAWRDLEAAARGVIRHKIEYLWETGRSIHPAIVDYWNVLVSPEKQPR